MRAVADQRNDGLMACKLERPEVTKPQVIRADSEAGVTDTAPATFPPTKRPLVNISVVRGTIPCLEPLPLRGHSPE
jgi:hypothetical protein